MSLLPSRRHLVAVVFGLGLTTGLGSSLAAHAAAQPVKVTYRTDGGVFVGVTVNDQPGAGAGVGNGRACAGLGEQIPFCTPPVDLAG